MSAGAAARAAAARAVGAVIGAGRSLDDALAAATGALQGPDRALAAQLAYGSLRLYPRLARWAGLLLARPLPPRDADVQALLAIGLYQIEASRVPDHAAVDASVEAARLLGRARHAGLLNACLRRWLREGDALKARVAREPEVVHAHPRWWLDALAHDWPRDWEALVAANNTQAPMWVRVNCRRTSREAWLARALAAGIEAEPWDAAPDALRLEKPVAVEELPGFAAGDVSVQDGAAQLAAGLLAPEPGMRVLDACAAPGGKACHLLERYEGIELTALDVAAARLERVRDNLARLGLEAQVLQGDAADPASWWDGRWYERVLLDAPCTGSGVVRRHPDIKLLRRPGDTAALGARQQALLDALWGVLAPGGRLLYATCSIWRAENAAQATGFLRRHPDARAVDFGEPAWGRRAGPGRQLLSGEAGADGFYYACLVKTA
ncbi:16S rRNA (cytosine(967)-C(5))-methyltransferase RsmB [Thioalkalivibrio sp. XN279]|uniref:16S rRNA (cytosine(967)-C(5))-methyltransferase RsmB n=1 Tax=Thioalkalivibrio sp. XN279 TaxID=2714953 RepID=UPI00140BE947|nr:16S rRNA (cytosine(967)-C(5))-methyltransferase RsmB [Thioalkalivibrio sp. XN279]NHA15720.1 16S rRNA (cytosine(967)-C(5))-methyltransferase RsmB [Thioalkalivibrio sp. XN279]